MRHKCIGPTPSSLVDRSFQVPAHLGCINWVAALFHPRPNSSMMHLTMGQGSALQDAYAAYAASFACYIYWLPDTIDLQYMQFTSECMSLDAEISSICIADFVFWACANFQGPPSGLWSEPLSSGFFAFSMSCFFCGSPCCSMPCVKVDLQSGSFLRVLFHLSGTSLGLGKGWHMLVAFASRHVQNFQSPP